MKCFIFFIIFTLTLNVHSETKNRPNFVFIFIDDLVPALPTYGNSDVHAPNISKLANEGIQFNRTYCNVPVCGASRASLLSGLRPHWPNRFTNYNSRADEDCPEVVTLPEHLLKNGYTTISNGKVFHHQYDTEKAWSEPPWKPDTTTVINFLNVNYLDSASIAYINPKRGAGPYYEAADAPDSLYFDGKLARKTIRDIQKFAKNQKPFFLAVGFHKPHLPFNAPKKYFDRYNQDEIAIAENRCRPKNLPSFINGSREIFTYGRLDHYNTVEFHHEARKAYYACITFVDTQIGLILNELNKQHLTDNTIVILIGDHGYHLGEHNFWGKHNVLIQSLHSPMIFKIPGNKSDEISKITEFVDIYPTLCDIAGIKKPHHLQGKTMMPLIKGSDMTWENRAFAEWQGARTIITDRYSYTTWINENNEGTEMLFDHRNDPLEKVNIAGYDKYKNVVKEHKSLIDSLYQTY